MSDVITLITTLFLFLGARLIRLLVLHVLLLLRRFTIAVNF